MAASLHRESAPSGPSPSSLRANTAHVDDVRNRPESRPLSPIRIAMPGYGTRASTVLVVYEGTFRLVERTIAPSTSSTGEVAIEGRFGR